MSLKTLTLELGALHTPAEVAHLFGRSAKTVRQMCAAGEIDCHVEWRRGKDGTQGKPLYLISENAVRAWRRKHAYPAS